MRRAGCSSRRGTRRARLHFPAWLDAAPVEQERIDEMTDMAAAGASLERRAAAERAAEAASIARLLRRSTRK